MFAIFVQKYWSDIHHGKTSYYRGWYLFGFIPLYIRIQS